MSFLKNIFSGKGKEVTYPVGSDFSSIHTDIHNHLIPGIDDGVKTIEESIEMIRGMAALGFKKIVTTPHIMSDFFKNNPEIINEGLESVRAAIKLNNIDIEFHAAAEYYIDEGFLPKLHKDKLLAINGKYVLFEISYINPPDNLPTIIFELSVNGYVPVLAHPERYPFWYDKFDEFRRLKDTGALFQMNTNSLTGYYGHGAKVTAEKMIDANMIDFVGSDLHGQRHLDGLHKVLNEKYFWKLVALGVKNKLL